MSALFCSWSYSCLFVWLESTWQDSFSEVNRNLIWELEGRSGGHPQPGSTQLRTLFLMSGQGPLSPGLLTSTVRKLCLVSPFPVRDLSPSEPQLFWVDIDLLSVGETFLLRCIFLQVVFGITVWFLHQVPLKLVNAVLRQWGTPVFFQSTCAGLCFKPWIWVHP
jgi:hypothetical protein